LQDLLGILKGESGRIHNSRPDPFCAKDSRAIQAVNDLLKKEKNESVREHIRQIFDLPEQEKKNKEYIEELNKKL